MENSLFPIKLGVHIVFALAALLVFGIQFIRFRKKYHLVLAIAIPLTLLPYLAENNMSLFYGVGVFEAAALIASLILAKTVDRDKSAVSSGKEETEQEKEEAAEQEAVPTEAASHEEASEPEDDAE